MSDDPLDGPAARAWRDARREGRVPADFAANVLAAHASPGTSVPPPLPPPQARLRGLEVAALAAGSAWFVARVAGLFLVFSAS